MKQLRIIVAVVLICFVASVIYSQEVSENTADVVKTEDSLSPKVPEKKDVAIKEDDALKETGGAEDNNSVGTVDVVNSRGKDSPYADEGNVSKEKKPAVTVENVSKEKSKPEKVVKKKTEEASVKSVPLVKEYDNSDLLKIEDGDYRYKRIPGISLETRESISAEVPKVDIPPVEDVVEQSEEPTNGFFGLGKTVANSITKGGIILLIFLIFIIYTKRMKGTAKRGTKKKVLNSYRK